MSDTMKTLRVPAGHMSQAVSDGVLNSSSLSAGGSSRSLGGSSASVAEGGASRVVGWAVGIERLLEDPVGVEHFTAFLKSEVSAENILFWQACERFRQIPASQVTKLKEEARCIFDTYLSDSSLSAVNIDDAARTQEEDLENPTPEMFQKAQQQIFKLMKFDSYARFVRSPVYQSCMLACVEGRSLPGVGDDSKTLWRGAASAGDGKKTSTPDNKSMRKKKLENRGSWGDLSYQRVAVTRKESQISVKSTSSMELGSISGRSENGRSSMCDPGQGSGGGGQGLVSGPAEGYCCVYLPDGTASLAPARSGLLLRDLLSGLCEKRGLPLKDVIIYLQGKDKPLSLDQDSSVLRDQQVCLELRVTVVVEVVFTGNTVGIMAKSGKTLQDAVAAILQKHQLRPQDSIITVKGSKDPLKMDTNVFHLANKTLCLDRVRVQSVPQETRSKPLPRAGRPNEMDDLMEMLSRAQCSRVDDQRGLLKKEHLVLPAFLKVPDHHTDEDPEMKGEKHSSVERPVQPTSELKSRTVMSDPSTMAQSTLHRQGSGPITVQNSPQRHLPNLVSAFSGAGAQAGTAAGIGRNSQSSEYRVSIKNT
ncbi:regulator of G-protein signaling 14-like isoform X2 [Denticeps clupeoides]|uniref:regulator of G-protein signaling 14-like isoform X2 n=1 Tax=Denticeps clupeoides TaxID=299321 RepID=UPI0010A31202|nr:regulator of G-protein signaling 14-like isoform X2 [Denticeps clupeoides]XP_028816838.1 regulator of G-protein signaling 14-like isoform X2 [Denticeps clupeoides]